MNNLIKFPVIFVLAAMLTACAGATKQEQGTGVGAGVGVGVGVGVPGRVVGPRSGRILPLAGSEPVVVRGTALRIGQCLVGLIDLAEQGAGPPCVWVDSRRDLSVGSPDEVGVGRRVQSQNVVVVGVGHSRTFPSGCDTHEVETRSSGEVGHR